MKQIQKSQTLLSRKNIINRIADVPGGISLTLADLVEGNVVPEATPVTAPTDGKRSICKQAAILDGSTTTVFRVESGMHQFAVGDVIMQATGGAAYAITAIAVGAGEAAGITYDTITVGTALESAAANTFIYESSAAGASAGALKNEADAILKFAFIAPAAGDYVIYPNGALLHADIVEHAVGALHLAQLKNITVVKY